MAAPSIPDAAPADDASDPVSRWVAERLSALLEKHGIPARHQAVELSQRCGLSLSQARRKLKGASWSFDEVLTIARQFDCSLDQLFSEAPITATEDKAVNTTSFLAQFQEATFLADTFSIPCHVRIGAHCVGKPDDSTLLTASTPSGWVVGKLTTLEHQTATLPFFHADKVLLAPKISHPPTRIAILDDEVGVSETLCDWFNAAGYEARAFNSGEQLLADNIEGYSAFIVDFMLSNGSSQEVIKAIRQCHPQAPIVLLTGKLRNGQASESELASLLRLTNVLFFEKPLRPSVIAATIETQLDTLAAESRR